MKTDFFVENDIRRQGFSVYMRQRQGMGRDALVYFAAPLEMRLLDPSDEALPVEPLATLDDDAVQQLMNELWRQGIRPSASLDDQTPLSHIKGEVEFNRRIIEVLITGSSLTPGRTEKP